MNEVTAKKQYRLHIHNHTTSSSEVIVNPEAFPEYSDGDLVEIYLVGQKPIDGKNLVVQIKFLEEAKRTKSLEISLLNTIASIFELQFLDEICVGRIVNRDQYVVDFAEFTFKDQYISTGEAWYLKSATEGKLLYTKQYYNFQGANVRVRELSNRGQKRWSGVISADTKFTFRSRSCRIFWLVQMSREMWDYAPDGDLYFEKFLYGFAADVLRRWNLLETSHSLTVVYFSRMMAASTSKKSSQKKVDGPSDYYKVALDEADISNFSQETVMLTLKKEFLQFPRLLPIYDTNGPDATTPPRNPTLHAVEQALPSTAMQGNFLEALNVTLNVLEKHYLDRDLSHTGNSIVTISPASGVFQVDPNLMSITKQRMMDNGIGMDMVSLSQPPLHTVPLFIHRDPQDPKENIYDVPHWMHLSFLDPSPQSPRLVNTSSRLPTVLAAMLNNSMIEDFGGETPSKNRDNGNQGKDQLRRHIWSTPESFGHFVAQTEPWCSPLVFNDEKPSTSCTSLDEELECMTLHKNSEDEGHYEMQAFKAKCQNHDDTIFSYNQLNTQPQNSREVALKSEESTDSLKQRIQQLRVNTNTIGTSNESRKSVFSHQGSPQDAQIAFPISSAEGSFEKPSVLSGTMQGGIMFTSFHYNRMQQQRPRCRTYDSEDQRFREMSYNVKNRHGRNRSIESLGKRVVNRTKTTSFDDSRTDPSSQHSVIKFRASHLSTSISIPENSLNNQSLLTTQIQRRRKNFQDSMLGSPMEYEGSVSSDGNSPASPKLLSQSHSSADTLHSIEISLSQSETKHSAGTANSALLNVLKKGSTGKLQHKPRFGYNKQQPPNMYKVVDPNYQFLHWKKKFFSPFCRKDEEDLLHQRTHNRRRWSHVFPLGEVEFKRIPGPNYKSLCQPANLPLTVDYFPTETDLKNNFLERQYLLTLEDSESAFYKSEEELLRELVCQRLNQDFQVVIRNLNGKQHEVTGSDSNHEYILSMGHCIHLLKQTGDHQIEVKHYQARFGNNLDPGNSFSYTYWLWNPLVQKWQKVTRNFVRYVDEYNWNHSDNIVQGNLTDFTEFIKFRRIDFCVIPSGTTKNKDAEEEHITKLLAFIDYLNSRAAEQTEMKDVEVLRRLTRPEGTPEPAITYEKWIPKHDIKVCFKNQKDHIDKWLFCNCDKILDPEKCYHVAIHWLVCTGVKVFDFVTSLLRKANQLGLNLAQIQHNVRTKSLNLHAFQMGTHIDIVDPHLKLLAEEDLLEKFGFVRDSGQETNWQKYGLALPWTHQSLDSTLTKQSPRRTTKWYKKRVFDHQFIHYSGSVYVRVSPVGFVWMTNIIKPDNNNYQGLTIEEKVDVSEKLFRQLSKHMENLQLVHSIVNDIVNNMLGGS